MSKRPRWRRPFSKGFAVEDMTDHIAAWAQRLGLASWDVRFSPVAPDPEDRGSVDIDPLHKHAALRLDPHMPLSQVDRTIVHELLHVLWSEAEDAFGIALKSLGPAEAETLRAIWKRGEEFAIERTVDALLPKTSRGQWSSSEAWNAAFPS